MYLFAIYVIICHNSAMKSIFKNLIGKLSWTFIVWTIMSLSLIESTRFKANELLESAIYLSYDYAIKVNNFIEIINISDLI